MRDAGGPRAGMMVSFKNNGLADLFETGKTGKISKKLPKRVPVRPERSDVAERPDDMNLPGCDLRALNGFDPTRYPVHVSGPFLHSTRIRGGQMLSVCISGRITTTVNGGSYVRLSRKRCPSHSRALPDGIIPATGKTRAEMAGLRGLSRQHAYEIIAERKPVSPDLAAHLDKLFRDGPGLWPRTQAAYDAWHARHRMLISGAIPTLKVAGLAGVARPG